jgi:RimJ/RimL family protein N-acetyltransferase
VELRRAVPDDAELLAAMLEEPSAAAYLRIRDDAAAELREELTAADPAVGERLLILDGDEIAGTLRWRVTSHRSRIAELSEVVVRPEARGRGLALAAVRAVCRHLFNQVGMHRIQLETFGDNLAGRETFTRAGFVQEGVRRRAYWRREAYQDGVIFGLLAEDSTG